MKYVAPSKALAHVDRLAMWKAGMHAAPVTVEIDLSNACSLGCQSCHFAHTHVAGPWAAVETAKPADYSQTGKFMDMDLLSRGLSEMAAASVLGVVFSGGGEPTLHPKFDAIVDLASGHGLHLGMYTLGGHLPLHRSERVRWSFDWVVVSLDAADAETYAAEKSVPVSRFEDACEGIRRLTGGPCVVGVSFLLHAGNWSSATDMLELARLLGATYATFRPTIETSPAQPSVPTSERSWVTDALPTLRALQSEPDVEVDPDRFVEYRDWAARSYQTCYGVRMVTQVTPDGRVWICPNRRGMAGSELGDLRIESFADIWARHPGQWTDFTDCRVMCRLHLMNQTLYPVFTPAVHEAFL